MLCGFRAQNLSRYLNRQKDMMLQCFKKLKKNILKIGVFFQKLFVVLCKRKVKHRRIHFALIKTQHSVWQKTKHV